MYCHNCGKKIDDSAKFCSFCGAKQILVEDSSNNDSTTSIPSINKSSVQNPVNKKEITPAAKTVSSTTNGTLTSTPQEKKSYGCLIAAILIVVFIVGITIALVKIVDINKTNDNSSSSGGSGVHLFYRDANNGDIVCDMNSDISNLGIKILITPQQDISNLSVLISLYDKNKNVLWSTTKQLGNVTTGNQINVSYSILEIGLSNSLKGNYISVAVVGGTVSYFN